MNPNARIPRRDRGVREVRLGSSGVVAIVPRIISESHNGMPHFGVHPRRASLAQDRENCQGKMGVEATERSLAVSESDAKEI